MAAKKASSSSGKVSSGRYKGMSKSQMALPGEGKYPIDSPARARNALARAAQNATPAQQAKVRAAVKKKYPSIQVTSPKKAKKSK